MGIRTRLLGNSLLASCRVTARLICGSLMWGMPPQCENCTSATLTI
jgi:hypothetical protein